MRYVLLRRLLGRLSYYATHVLPFQTLDILDTEASEDEATRKEYPVNRPPSHEANVELTDKAQRYRQILTQAKESDEVVRQKWYEWEDHIRQLTENEASLPFFSGVSVPGP